MAKGEQRTVDGVCQRAGESCNGRQERPRSFKGWQRIVREAEVGIGRQGIMEEVAKMRECHRTGGTEGLL